MEIFQRNGISPFKIFVTITAGILDFKYTVAKDADRVVREKILG